MEITPLISTKNSFTLFLAPPAWGKTTLLLNLPGPWIFVSPLRALAEEFYERVQATGERVKILRSRKDETWAKFCKNPRGILIATPETLPSHFPQNILEQCFMVLDEFHLFLHWGETFRPYLTEQFFSWANQGIPVLGLSATVDQSQLQEIQLWREHCFDHLFVINVGNMQFKHPPTKHTRYGKRVDRLKRRMVFESLNENNRGIIFCGSRAQVFYWCNWLNRRGVKSLGCVGGQVEQFRQGLKENPDATWIVTTSALSHGVNLPSFDHVFIAHEPDRESIWLQMAARGGRKGEKFHLHSLQKAKAHEKMRVWLFDILVKFKLYLSL